MRTIHARFKFLSFITGILLLSALLFIGCQKEDEVKPFVKTFTNGSEIVTTVDDEWRFDKAHSSVRWETLYLGKGAMLTGRFNDFRIDVNFNEADLENSSIAAWVRISAVHSGEPGRDGLAGCLQTSLGLVHNGDTLANGARDPKGIVEATNFARFTSTNIQRHGDGFIAIGDFELRGVKQSETLYFNYLGQEKQSPTKDELIAGFSGALTFNALSDYKVSSTNIADKVTLTVHAQYKK